MRRQSRQVNVGGVAVGGGAPVSVQSMLNVPVADIKRNVQQAIKLKQAGCEILRVSLPELRDARLIKAIKKEVDTPLVADIHFDYKIALAAIEQGVDKIRINPGNIGDKQRVKSVVSACKERGVPIRIGVNGGSLEKDLLEKYEGPTAEALAESALRHVAILEEEDFFDIVISLKSSNVPSNVKAYQILAQKCDYPLHLGVTEAGPAPTGLVKNAVGIGSLLLSGIGDTLRVSLTGSPIDEVQAGFDILKATGHKTQGVEIISCPTCGRCCIPVEDIALKVQKRLASCVQPITVAVMGCVVNGIGEGKQADIGIAGGKDCAVLFAQGERLGTVHGDYAEKLIEEIEQRWGKL